MNVDIHYVQRELRFPTASTLGALKCSDYSCFHHCCCIQCKLDRLTVMMGGTVLSDH